MNRIRTCASPATVATIFLLFLVMSPAVSFSAPTAYAQLTADGEQIIGESLSSSQAGIDGTEVIEVLQFSQQVQVRKRGRVSRLIEYLPIRILKRVDKSSPLLMKALVENQRIDGTITFFKPNPENTPGLVVAYEIAITQARIVNISINSPNSIDATSAQWPMTEYVDFELHGISWKRNDLEDGQFSISKPGAP